jgi:osmotically inducible protein OsmC
VERKASAVWTGTLREGTGTITTPSGVLRDVPYTFANRFERVEGTSPEELVAAAHAACFSMAFSGKLVAGGLNPSRIVTTATVTLEKLEAGQTVTGVHLDVTAHVPGATPDAFDQAAESARATCPISRLINARITMSARLE